MSEYEGLNLPELLARMHDLVPPETIVWWPQTDGWWVLGAWFLALILAGVMKTRQRRVRNRYRREALQALSEVELTGNPNAGGQVAAILKRCALTLFPRSRVASLYGEAWAEFLIETGGNDPIIQEAAPQIARAASDPRVQAAGLLQGAERWIRHHRD